MKLNDCLTDFLRYIQYERGLSLNTVRCYRAQLNHFSRWLAGNGYPEPTPECLTLPTFRRFLYSLSGRGLRPRTVISYFDPLDGLCAFLVANGALPENAVKSLTLPKKDAAHRKTVSNEEVRLLLEASERCRNPRRAALRRAVIHTLVYSGLRRAELLALNLEDVNLDEKSLLVRCGKGSKSRRVFLPVQNINALREWLALRGECKDDALFIVDIRRGLGDIALMNMLEEVKSIAGLTGHDNIKPHGLRHWRATDLLRSGADLRSIQAFLGHSSLAITSVYLHTNEEQCRDIADLSTLKPQTLSTPDNVIDLRERPQQEHTRRRHTLRRIGA